MGVNMSKIDKQLEEIAKTFNERTEDFDLKVLAAKPDDPNTILNLPLKAQTELLRKKTGKKGRPRNLTKLEQKEVLEEMKRELLEDEKRSFDERIEDLRSSLTSDNSQDNQHTDTKTSAHQTSATKSPSTTPLTKQDRRESIDQNASSIGLLEQVEGVESIEQNSNTGEQGRRVAEELSFGVKGDEIDQLGARTEITNIQKVSRKEEKEKVSHALAIVSPHEMSRKMGKTSLCYLALYGGYLTEVEIDKLLDEKRSKLPLTANEKIALKLLKNTLKNDPKSEKIYWDLMKTMEKDRKIQQNVNRGGMSLLDEALEAEEAEIFGVDNSKPL